MAEYGLARILAIIGGVLMVVDGSIAILRDLSISLHINYTGGGVSSIEGILGALFAIIIGILVLISTGVIRTHRVDISFSGVSLIVLGVLGIIFASTIGGVLVLIGGILLVI
jgi:hypothetical protein